METPETRPETMDLTPIPERPRRTRRVRKRTAFRKIPKPAWPVRGLWEAAPQEEQRRAHEACMKILEYWLGKKAKVEIADELGVTPLRVWQLSQQALSGMMAGLLKQPRRRVGPEAFEPEVIETKAELKRRIAELQRQLVSTEDLVRVLRNAPWLGPAPESTPKGGSKRGRTTKKRRTARPKGNATASRQAAQGDQHLSPGAPCAG
jgi:hypothetical protein